jgi:hypothetical protein
MKKIYAFRGQKDENKLSWPKISMVVGDIHRSEILYEVRKSILLGVKKTKIIFHGPKTEFGVQNQYARGRKGKNKTFKKTLLKLNQSPNYAHRNG